MHAKLTQVLLYRGADVRVEWIAAEVAEQGQVIDIMDRGDWSNGWTIDHPIPEAPKETPVRYPSQASWFKKSKKKVS